MTLTVMVIVIGLRLGLPLLIPRSPLPAIIACLVVDAIDQTVFDAVTDDPLEWYQTYDKALDVFYLSVAYISTMQSWQDPFAFGLARFLFFYRLIGVTAFEFFEQRWMLFVFPNTFEYFFIAYEAIRTRWNPLRLPARTTLFIAIGIWVVIKLPQEWWVHIAQRDFTDTAAAYPIIWPSIVGIGLFIGGLIYRNRRRIPAPDWPFTFDGHRHLNPPLYRDPDVEPFWSAVLVEKAILVALLGGIFANMMPSIDTSLVRVAGAVGILVIVNAGVTQWLRRRGRSWTGALESFLSTLIINYAILMADGFFRQSPVGIQGAIDRVTHTNALLLVLLSFLIAMFDRYRISRPRKIKLQIIEVLRGRWGTTPLLRRHRLPSATSPVSDPDQSMLEDSEPHSQ